MTKFKRLGKEERKEEIRNAARIAFLNRGYRNTTMEDVIKHTTLSKGGVYRYYNNTKDILMDLMRYGNEYRFNVFSKLFETMIDNATFDEIFVAMGLNKMLDDTPDKKIYAMFLSEILYDKDIRDLYHSLEAATFERLKTQFFDSFEFEKKFWSKNKYILISRIISGIILSDQLLNEDNLYLKHQDEIKSVLETLLISQ